MLHYIVMWQDEIDDPEYQDQTMHQSPTIDRSDFFNQPITAYAKNILNALTGEDTGYRIGSQNEKRFYVVMENDPSDPKEARRLYFESPIQYEMATGIKVSRKSKERFYANQKLFL